MPLVILLAALVMMYWGSHREARKKFEIQQYVQRLCDDAASGRIIVDRLNNPNPLVASQTAEEMKDAWTPSVVTSREINVNSGDVPQFNIGTATHTAMLRVNGQDVLGLRILHQDEGGPIEILGYWRP